MTEPAPPPPDSTIAPPVSSAASSSAAPSPYIQVWVESFAEVLGQILGAPLPLVALAEAPAELTPPGDTDLWIICACSGGLRGEMSLRLPPAYILRLAQLPKSGGK